MVTADERTCSDRAEPTRKRRIYSFEYANTRVGGNGVANLGRRDIGNLLRLKDGRGAW
mgnify:FL=1